MMPNTENIVVSLKFWWNTLRMDTFSDILRLAISTAHDFPSHPKMIEAYVNTVSINTMKKIEIHHNIDSRLKSCNSFFLKRVTSVGERWNVSVQPRQRMIRIIYYCYFLSYFFLPSCNVHYKMKTNAIWAIELWLTFFWNIIFLLFIVRHLSVKTTVQCEVSNGSLLFHFQTYRQLQSIAAFYYYYHNVEINFFLSSKLIIIIHNLTRAT